MTSQQNRYPRNMIGYGANFAQFSHANPDYPKVIWPNQAKIAIQIVLNYEEGGENCTLHGDKASEAFLSEIVGASAWEGQRHWNMESIYEYGARAGFWRLYELFTKRKLPITVFGVATALKRSPEQVNAMLLANWEIASHGLKWIEYKDYRIEAERKDMEEAISMHQAIIGEYPQGWYTGRCSVNTIDMLARTKKFRYLSDSYADDLPYWLEVDGHQQLIVPYTLDSNDMRFATPQGFNSGEQFYTYLKDSFDVLYQEGNAGFAKMLSIGLHCRLIGRPGRMAGLIKFLDYAQSFNDVWFATRLEIAEHWHQHHQPKPLKMKPSSMNHEEFIKVFGSIYEHSAFIAERAYKDEISYVHDSAIGMAQLLRYHFRQASAEERLGVLNAHPDLAGKLAAAKRLTAESTLEQKSAGLDGLTDQEKAIFTSLNDRYKQKFGFPFIMAVKGRSKAEILTAFQVRIEHDQNQEFETACAQVEQIAKLRLTDLFS